jgi:hypothetical protein
LVKWVFIGIGWIRRRVRNFSCDGFHCKPQESSLNILEPKPDAPMSKPNKCNLPPTHELRQKIVTANDGGGFPFPQEGRGEWVTVEIVLHVSRRVSTVAIPCHGGTLA